jgi:anti-sigma regulatory factor (Ser/Thr protein kinase)
MSREKPGRQPEPEGYRPAKSMKKDRFELKVDNRLENLSIISDFISKAMRQIGANERSIAQVQLAVDEACTNVIMYAYSGCKGTVKIALELMGDDLIVTIRDRGKPFDPSSVPPPDLEADLNERKIGGLGMYLMRKVMDEVSYSFNAEEGNKLTMRKHLIAENSDLEGV